MLIDAVKLNKNVGSSTAVLAKLDEPDIIKTTNLGDSCYVIFTAQYERNAVKLKKVFRSKE